MFSRFHNNVLTSACNACLLLHYYHYQFWILHGTHKHHSHFLAKLCMLLFIDAKLISVAEDCTLLVPCFLIYCTSFCKLLDQVRDCSIQMLCCEMLLLNITLLSTFVFFNALSNCINLPLKQCNKTIYCSTVCHTKASFRHPMNKIKLCSHLISCFAQKCIAEVKLLQSLEQMPCSPCHQPSMTLWPITVQLIFSGKCYLFLEFAQSKGCLWSRIDDGTHTSKWLMVKNNAETSNNGFCQRVPHFVTMNNGSMQNQLPSFSMFSKELLLNTFNVL